jgi:polygalacturonase
VIDGNGERWWTEYWQLRNANDPDLEFKTRRPRLLRFTNCRQVCVADLKLQNQAVWCLHFLFCVDVVASNLTIRAGHNAPSSDGIDVDSTRQARISRCDIDVNDDCISIKAGLGGDARRLNRPSEDVVVENCRFGYGHGGVAIGSETFGGIRNVEVRNCVAEAGNWAPVRFKTNASRGGVVENIAFRDMQVHDVRQVFEVNMAWKPQPKRPQVDLPVFRNLQFINITGTANSVGTISGLKDSPVQNVKFEAVKISAQRGLIISNARDLDLTGLKAEVKEGEPIVRRTAD